MVKFMKLEIDNSKKSSIASGGWSDPGAKLYDQLLQSYYCVGDLPADGKSMERAIKEGKYKQWYDFLEEAYLIAPIKDIKNSPYGVTPYTRSGCKYPHHVIKNGKLVVSIPGIKAAYARAKQAGIFKGKVKEHLERHYKEMGIYQGSTIEINERIEQNFDEIEGYILEATGIDLHCPMTIYEENIDNGVIRPLMRDDVTNPYFVNWLFRSYEFSDNDPEEFDYDMLVNNDAMGNYVYGYFVNDKLEGIIKVKHRKPEDYYAVSMMFVNDQNESKGIGQSLMKYVINKYGDKEMRLNVFAYNSRAMHIYKKYGFDIASSGVAKPEADGDTGKLTGQKFYKMIRKPTEYDPPLSFDKLPDHLKRDPVHAWRAKTGIELIHKEPTIEELNRIWDNWNKMSDEQKSISDQKSMELFGKNNHDHYMELVNEYNKTNDQPAISIFPSGHFSEHKEDLSSINTPEELLEWMDCIQYGWMDKSGNICGTGDDDNENHFFDDYRLQSPEQLTKTKVGVCWDQSELERKWFSSHGYPHAVIYLEIDDGQNCPSHTFLLYMKPNDVDRVYWFEHSWGQMKGIHKYLDVVDCIRNVAIKHQMASNATGKLIIKNISIPPKSGSTCEEFMNHCRNSSTVAINHNCNNILNESVDRITPDKKYTMEDIPNIMYFSSPTKVTELKGRVFLTPYIGISSIFTIDRFNVLKDYAKKMLVAKQVFLNANIGYDEWGLPNSKLLKPLSLVHMTHNIKDLPGVAKGTSTGYIYTVDISDIDKDQLSMFVTMDPDREIIYKGDKPLKIINVQEHTANWELRFDPENMERHGVGSVKIAESYSSIDELKKEYCTERSDNMDEDDDLNWITEYLMEDVEPKNASDNEKYNITHRKSKYKGWVEYIVHSKDAKEAASCIINEKTGDCANVETKPEYRRQGYMQYLLKYLIKFKGVKYAQVQQDNSIAISLYRKIGFEVEFKYTDKEKGPMYSMSFQGDVSKLIVEGYNFFTEAEEPPSMPDGKPSSTEEQKEEPENESMPKKTDKAESSKNGVRRKKLYIAFIEWCKEFNPKNTFGSIFDKDAFNVSYPFVPEEMRYFYRLANPMLCVLGGELTFFAASELRKLNSKNSHLNEMMIFAATPNDLRVFNVKDKKIYLGTEENGSIKLGDVLGDTFDTYIQKMINKGDILNGPLEESTDFE